MIEKRGGGFKRAIIVRSTRRASFFTKRERERERNSVQEEGHVT